ncbi:hypothetical protein DICSQDRAFT_171369 [Dichomitus squalens LYAD-421 SS1]|uniref:Uncharacterized protein n=1 Tax=Dichomitus squalens (strain LYAD-421) TaxID=732165 RepID=R7SWQ0_DICSQ|nr:uncharacterized protein DICSQDRAFT_171369 [Dichomitus squalens LYAD-421 SS1]EJF60145.1 hypothetical protein DICSQDRAFT_171369 [Dichomitus squalens LYAD-421 SS1]
MAVTQKRTRGNPEGRERSWTPNWDAVLAGYPLLQPDNRSARHQRPEKGELPDIRVFLNDATVESVPSPSELLTNLTQKQPSLAAELQ